MNTVQSRHIQKKTNKLYKETYELLPESGWTHTASWLVKLMIKLLIRWKVIRHEMYDVVITYKYTPQQIDSLTQFIHGSADNLSHMLDVDPSDVMVLCGQPQYEKIMKETHTSLYSAFPFQLQSGALFSGFRDEYGYTKTEIMGIPIVVVPWMDGTLAVSRKLFTTHSGARSVTKRINTLL